MVLAPNASVTAAECGGWSGALRTVRVVQEKQGYVAPKLRQLIAEAAFRHKRIVLTTIGVVCGLMLMVTVLMHNRYEASAKLLVQNIRSAAQLTTSNVDHLVSQGDVSPAEINTEVDLLESDGVAQRAVAPAIVNGEDDLEAVKRLRRELSVQAVHQANVINLKMLGNTPDEAKAQLQELINAYFEERAGSASNSGAAEFFNSQLQQKTRQLNADQAALTAFEMQHGIADLDDQTKLQVARVSGLEDQIAQVSALLAAAQQKAATDARQLAQTSARSETQLRTITNQYSQERLNTALVELLNHRTELLKRYVPSDRQVVEINDKIATTKQAISEAADNPAKEQASDANPVWVQLSTQVATSGGAIGSLQGQQAAIRSQIAEARSRLNELEEAAGAYGELRRRMQQSQADYTLYAQRRDDARISEALDQQKLFNVAVVQPPLASLERVRPKPVLYMVCAFVFALCTGVALAIYVDLSGGRVHTPAQLDAWTGMRTLATLADEYLTPGMSEANNRQFRRILFTVRQAVADLRRSSQDEAMRFGRVEAQRSLFRSVVVDGDPFGYCIAFTSALPGEGVSFIVNRLAAEASRQISGRVAVLDTKALLESPELDQGIRPSMCLDAGAEHWVLALPETSPGKLPQSTPDRRAQLSLGLRAVLREVRQEFDLVLLDCPSLHVSTVAGEMGSCIDGYVSVVQAGKVRKQNLEDLTFQLASGHAPILGHILNRRDYPIPHWLHKVL